MGRNELTRLGDEFTHRAFAVVEVGGLEVAALALEEAVRDYHTKGGGDE